MSELADGAVLVLPGTDQASRGSVKADDAFGMCERTHQVAVVTRGMRSSSGIFDSSIEILESLPGFSLCSTEWALL